MSTAYRSHHRFVDSSFEALAALHEMAHVGDVAVLEAAFPIAEGLGKLSSTYRPTRVVPSRSQEQHRVGGCARRVR